MLLKRTLGRLGNLGRGRVERWGSVIKRGGF
jgi:hypothetical protein